MKDIVKCIETLRVQLERHRTKYIVLRAMLSRNVQQRASLRPFRPDWRLSSGKRDSRLDIPAEPI